MWKTFLHEHSIGYKFSTFMCKTSGNIGFYNVFRCGKLCGLSKNVEIFPHICGLFFSNREEYCKIFM